MMLNSMTGYGRASRLHQLLGAFTVEIRSVNHRFCEVVVHAPPELNAMEETIKRCVRDRVHRGRVTVWVHWSAAPALPKKVVVDRGLLAGYREAMGEVADLLEAPIPRRSAWWAALPGVLRIEGPQLTGDELWEAVEPALREALDQLVAMREHEGRAAAREILGCVQRLRSLLHQMSRRAPEVAEEYRARIMDRLKDWLSPEEVDALRLAQEVALLAERSDVSEEISRGLSHLEQLEQTVRNGEGPRGRKLEFILQELGRELNTLGAKSNDFDLSSWAVEGKLLVERMREQAQNVE